MAVGSLVATLGAQSVPAHAAPTTFSGQATVVDASVFNVPPVVLVDTGFHQGASFAEHDHLLTANVPGLLTAEALHAATIGQKKAADSEASVANLSLTVGGNTITITAGFLMAQARAECQGGTAAVSGSSEIATLVINGTPITVTGQPDQTVSLPGGLGQVTINEQDGSASGGSGTIMVNALHVEVFGVADVVISHAHADITCGDVGAGNDFVTGGGWITGTPSGARGTFGVAGGSKNGAWWGHLTYIDHGSNMHVKSTAVTKYEVVNATTRHIEYTCENNGTIVGTCKVDVADNGEPGRNDTFTIDVPPAYAGGSLQGGNIQLH
jgi:hypothetical protein